MRQGSRLSRRTLLRGAGGIAIGLPLLEAMRPRRASAQRVSPRRIVFEFKPNGDQTNRRMLDTDPVQFRFDEFLQPLEPYRDDLLVLNRLDKRFDRFQLSERGDNHQQGSMGLAPWPQGAGDFSVFGADRRIGYVQGPSADYVIGEETLRQAPALPYRHLLYRVGGLNNGIANQLSHAGPVGTQNPLSPETDPQSAFLRLFGDNQDEAALAQRRQQLTMKRSVLDFVREANQRLHGQLAPGDRQKVEQFNDALRDLERTLVPREPGTNCTPSLPGASVNAYSDANHPEVGRQFQRLIALAFACDLTRTVNFAWGGGISTRAYPEVGVSEPHHDLSHVSSAEAFAGIRAIHRHLWTLSTNLYEELKAIPEGDGSLWEHTLVVHWNELGQGDLHTINDQLVIFAGRSGGYFRRGRYCDYANDVGFSDMLLSCLHYMGLEGVETFGDPRLASGGPIAGITA